jgi:hypothetical protein
MKARSAVIVAVLLLMTATEGCRHKETGPVLTVDVTEADGMLVVNPGFIRLPAKGTPATVKWSSSTGVSFDVEFLYYKPCEGSDSDPDQHTFVCHIPSDHQSAFAFRVVKADHKERSRVVLARVGSCGACDAQLKGSGIGIACDKGGVKSTLPDATVVPGATIEWMALGDDAAQWSVVFTGKSPCAEATIDNAHPTCKVTGSEGQYPYTTTWGQCNPGAGKIVVQ